MRLPHSDTWWQSEVEFIEVEAEKPKKMDMFQEYCQMQAKFAARDGYPELAARIETARSKS